MKALLCSCALLGALVLVGCDAASPDTADASRADARGGASATFTIPTTPGASEWDYVNVDANNAPLPPTWEHPVYGGIISPEWLGYVPPPGTSTYEDLGLGQGSTVGERLLWVGQRMLTRPTPPPEGFGGADSSGVTVSSASFVLPSSWEHWQNALIAPPSVNDAFRFTIAANYRRASTVTFQEIDGSTTYGVRGGREPGGFVFIEGRGVAGQWNRQDRDPQCDPDQTQFITHTRDVFVSPSDAPQGARMKVGVYAQVGELYLRSPSVCDGFPSTTASVVDIEARTFTYFRRTSEAAFTVDGAAASPTTVTEVSTGTFPATVALALTAPTSGESVTGVFVRPSGETFFVDRTLDVKMDSPTALQLGLGEGLHHVVLTTSTDRLARGSLSVCGGVNGCPGDGSETG